MPRKAQSTQRILPKTLVVGVHAPYNRLPYIQSYFDEFINLVKTAELPQDKVHFTKLREIDSSYFLTKGKLQELVELCKENNIELVVFSEPLSSMQERNLEDLLDAEIIDRTKLILDIFENAAVTNEGKTQVAIAQLQHAKARLAGKGIFLGQQKGGTAMRTGAGETLKEREKRHIEQLILKLKKQLKKIEQARQTQRKRRLGSGVKQVALIGYTNAGKSTLLNTLAKANVLAQDKLFATLDTTTRELFVDSKKVGIISDTVGFIQELPHQLIEAFKSTLSELGYADLLLHVVDLSDPNWQNHIRVVHNLLDDLGVEKEMVYVFNKKDKVDNLEEVLPLVQQYRPHVIISADDKASVTPLTDHLSNWHALQSPQPPK
jgi:GTP-binding protein HflX